MSHSPHQVFRLGGLWRASGLQKSYIRLHESVSFCRVIYIDIYIYIYTRCVFVDILGAIWALLSVFGVLWVLAVLQGIEFCGLRRDGRASRI